MLKEQLALPEQQVHAELLALRATRERQVRLGRLALLVAERCLDALSRI